VTGSSPKLAGSAWLLPLVRHVALRALVYALCVGVALPSGLLLGTLVFAETALANTYDAGLALYQKANFKGAETALRQALGKNPAAGERARILKLLGICQFMQGGKAAAASTFKQALSLNPALRIGAGEVLDERVIAFFEQQRGAAARKPAAAAKAAPARPAAAKTRTAATARPAAPAAARPGMSGKPMKSTFLKVTSNVANATVMIDGIIAGPVNSLINTDPGTIEIEVSANGYLTKRLRVTIEKNRENAVAATLSKPAPKPKPKPKPAPKPAAVARAPAKKSGGKASRKKGIYAPSPKDDLFGEAADAPDDPSAGTGASGADLASEFEMEAAGYTAAPQPAYNAPPPGYAAPPAYAPPAYTQPAAQAYAPYAPPAYAPPGYYQQPAPTYYPPPPPPPPAQPAYDPYAAPAYMPPAAAADPGAAGRSGRRSRKKSAGNNLFVALLPFGAGQFQNHNYLLGLAFMAAEGGALFMWYSKNQAADKTVEETNAYVKENTDIPDADKPAFDTYVAERQKYVDQKRQEASLFLYGFVGLYAAGVIEAIINDNPPKAKSKKRKKRRYSGFAAKGGGLGRPIYKLIEPEERAPQLQFRWGLGLTPPATAALTALPPSEPDAPATFAGPAHDPLGDVPGVAVKVQWTF
jgi:hypothetical protein